MKSLEIKHAILSYFRYTRQCICASECLNNDVMVITKNGYTLDIEIKISKYDLWKGEARKSKHINYKKQKRLPTWSKNYQANKFYICVPTELLEEAKRWVESVNSKYGIIECINPYSIFIVKRASLLHKIKSEHLAHSIMMRVCSENIGLIKKVLLNKENRDEI